MKRFSFWFLAMGGGVAGLFSTLHQDLDVKIVMVIMGGVVGTILGAIVSGIAQRRHLDASRISHDDISGIGFSPDDQVNNYWRDKGESFPMPSHPDPEGVRNQMKL